MSSIDDVVVGEPSDTTKDEDADVEIMEPMADTTELVFRQVPAGHFKYGRVTSQAFTPMPKDNFRLSVDRAAKTTAEGACLAFIANGGSSIGSWAVTVGECASFGLSSVWNPNPKLPDGTRLKNEAHSLIDYSSLKSNSQVKAQAARLSAIAHERGCQYSMQSNNKPPDDAGGGA